MNAGRKSATLRLAKWHFSTRKVALYDSQTIGLRGRNHSFVKTEKGCARTNTSYPFSIIADYYTMP